MCSKPRIPKQPKVQRVPPPEVPEETAQEIGRSTSAQKRGRSSTLGKFDLRLPPSFQVPSSGGKAKRLPDSAGFKSSAFQVPK